MEQTLHPLVALAPAIGLCLAVVIHLVLTHCTRGRFHLASLGVALAAGLLLAEGVAWWGVCQMNFFVGESPMPLLFTVGVAVVALGYGYFTFVNLNTTSLRIRLLREILVSPGHSLEAVAVLEQYEANTITQARLSRLQAWRQIQRERGTITLKKRLFWFLNGMVREVRKILITSARETKLARRIGRRSLARQSRHRLCAGLGVLLATSLGVLYFVGLANGLDKNVTERTRFHSIPVALAQILYNADHDYTSFKAIAIPYQAEGVNADTLLRAGFAQSSLASVAQSETYFWLADDRGSSDLVHLSFRLFGGNLSGLYNGYFSLIVISIGLAALSLRKDPFALGLLIVFVCAYASFLPEFLTATSSNQVFKADYHIHLSESRTFEMLGFVFALQSICLILRNIRINLITLSGLGGQAILFGFLLSGRSSLGWIVLFVLAFTALSAAWLAFFKCPNSRKFFRGVLWAIISGLLVFGGGQLFKGWHALAENPYYLAQGGARTFYHNALMGISLNPYLVEKYKLPSMLVDGLAIDAVNYWLASNKLPIYDKNELLNSLGGVGQADWQNYEIAAKGLYLHLWRQEFLQMGWTYLIKFGFACELVKTSIAPKVFDAKTDAHSPITSRFAIYPTPFNPILVILVTIPWILLFRDRQHTALILLILGFSFLFALIPSVAFYGAIMTISGASVLFRMAIYLAVPLLAAVAFEPSQNQSSSPWLRWGAAVACIGVLCWLVFQLPQFTKI